MVQWARRAVFAFAWAFGAVVVGLLASWLFGGTYPHENIRSQPELFAYLAVFAAVSYSVHSFLEWRSIHRLQETNRLLLRNSRIDPDTSLLTGPGLADLLDRMVALSRRRGIPMSMVRLHIEHFPAGVASAKSEAFVAELAKRLRGGRRREDLVARISREGFAVVMLGANLQEAGKAADKIVKSIRQLTFEFEGKKKQPTVWAGVVEWDLSDSGEYFLRRSSHALSFSRRTGKNRVFMAAQGFGEDAAAQASVRDLGEEDIDSLLSRLDSEKMFEFDELSAGAEEQISTLDVVENETPSFTLESPAEFMMPERKEPAEAPFVVGMPAFENPHESHESVEVDLSSFEFETDEEKKTDEMRPNTVQGTGDDELFELITGIESGLTVQEAEQTSEVFVIAADADDAVNELAEIEKELSKAA